MVLPAVESPSSGAAFPGLYTTGLPLQPFLGALQQRAAAARIVSDLPFSGYFGLQADRLSAAVHTCEQVEDPGFTCTVTPEV